MGPKFDYGDEDITGTDEGFQCRMDTNRGGR